MEDCQGGGEKNSGGQMRLGTKGRKEGRVEG